MKKMKINEIFYSLQGEGHWTGTPMIFVRFSGCNLNCSFCDTDHSAFTDMTIEQIISKVKSFGDCKSVCLTGGEPSLQVNQELVDALHREGFRIHIESNGTKELPQGIDWITVSPKGDKIALQKADEIKLVYLGQDVSKWASFPATFHYLQPCSCKNTQEVVNYILAHPKWRLSLQTHKYLDIR